MTTTGSADRTHRLTDPLLRIEGFTSGYGGTEVLRDVSLDIDEGEVVALIGRNGAGKTTTLRTILGNLIPTAGTVTFDGEEIGHLGPEETVKHGIALVPEERRIFPSLTVRENLELARLGGSGAGVRRDIDEVLDTFENLARNEHSAGSQLSGGEQQMVAIARALVGGARLLLLDEPTEGLAPFIVQRVEEVIEELSDEGLPILLVEQNVRVALDAADYVYVIDNGQIVHQGTAEEVRANQEVLDRYLGVTV
ncbi:ABC transporter ATP-binding protein [Haloarchaeobius sp. HRN-SO-5]|uniref:ABC transporter ATP-binding protein n=1 Tax=Haloarchaeobius sp. HRN-SO-5 TaxID=3446118 RepID=UPI003EBBC9E0